MKGNLIFTESYISNFNKMGCHFDRDYRRILSTNPAFKENREQLENYIQKYPEPYKSKWINDFQNTKDSCKPLISELKTYNLLVEAFGSGEIEIEPNFETTTKRPDFFVKKRIAFEVFAIMNIISPIEQEIYEIIGNLNTNLSFRLDKIYGVGDGRPTPSFKRFISQLEKLITEKSKITQEEKFTISFNGITASGVVNNIGLNGSIRSISTQRNYYPNIEEYEKKLRKTIRKRIKSKLTKYNELRHSNIGLVLVIDDWISHVFSSKLEWEQIFNGVETSHDINSNKNTESKMVWGEKKYRGLSMVLVKDKTRGPNYFHYFENQFTENSLAKKDLELIKKHFKDSEKQN